MADAYSTIRTRRYISDGTPVRKTSPTRRAVAGQVKNSAGGYVFDIGDEARLHRFLTMGTDGGTFYTSEPELTKQNAEVVIRAAKSAPLTLVRAITEVSTANRAPKYKPAIFALAIAASLSDDAGRKAALDAVPVVCRTATQLFLFMRYADQFRGWGRGLRKAVGSWYDQMPADKLAVQLVKYRQREGYTHTDALRLSADRGSGGDYLSTVDAEHALLYNYVTKRSVVGKDGQQLKGQLPDVILAYEALKTADSVKEMQALVQVPGVTWEMIPDKWMNDSLVWEALIYKGMPITALIRQLPRITNMGLAVGDTGRVIREALVDGEKLRYGKVHPMQLLVASKTYAQGHGDRGNLTWTPNGAIVGALTEGFYAAFTSFEPAGKSTLIGVDCSGSMGWDTSRTTGAAGMRCIEATAAVALVAAATEPDVTFVGFDTRAWHMAGISARAKLPDVMAYLKTQINGGTDTSMPIRWALENRVRVDTIQILTDGQTYRGSMHPFEAMKIYRERINPDAKLVTVAMTATNTSQVAPWDTQAIDVSGFDTAVPQIIADFSAGRI